MTELGNALSRRFVLKLEVSKLFDLVVCHSTAPPAAAHQFVPSIVT